MFKHEISLSQAPSDLFAPRFSIAYANASSILSQSLCFFYQIKVQCILSQRIFFRRFYSVVVLCRISVFRFGDRFLCFNDLINMRGEPTINATRIVIIKMKAVRWLFFPNLVFFRVYFGIFCFNFSPSRLKYVYIYHIVLFRFFFVVRTPKSISSD